MRFFIILLLIPGFAPAQKTAPAWSPAAVVSAGVIAGESTARPLIQASGGLHSGRHFGGLGAGLDPYRFKSVPVFAHWKMDIGWPRLVFAYGQAGYNLPYANGVTDDWFGDVRTTDRFSGGFYFDAGMGYRVRLKGRHSLLFSAGYSQKHLTHTVGYTWPCLVEPCPEEIEKNRYNLGRIMAKFSWEFMK